MTGEKTAGETESMDRIIAEARRAREERLKSYREQALKIHPWVCAKCTREFSGKKIRELTVHHKDHDHENNPPDGSNWELLCLYCHDNEHSRGADAEWSGAPRPGGEKKPTLTSNPFSDLEALKKNEKKK